MKKKEEINKDCGYLSELEQYESMLKTANIEYNIEHTEATSKKESFYLGKKGGIEFFRPESVPATTIITVYRGNPGSYTELTFNTETGQLLDLGAFE